MGRPAALPAHLERSQQPSVTAPVGRRGAPMRHPKYETLRRPVPVENWDEEDNTLRFGLPFGWNRPEDGLTLPREPGMMLLTSVTNWQHGDPQAGEVPLTARPYLCMFVADNTSMTGWEAAQEFEQQIFADPDGLARHRAGRLGQRPRDRARRILLN